MLMLPVGASAQETQQPSDPEADSPSGVVYELPFDRARRDAAPRRGERNGRRRGGADRDGGRGDGGAGGQTDGGSGGGPEGQTDGDSGGGPAPGRDPTSIRSENNFGSSSRVPGLDDGTDLAAGAGSDGRDGGSGSRRQDGASAGTAGAGIPSTGGQTGAGRSPLDDPATALTGGPSDATIISLLGLILIVGGGLGVMAARARRRSSS